MIGFIKFGNKNLYLYKKKGQIIQKDMISVLDFYVEEQYQRCGIGKTLFDEFLKFAHCHPIECAYDRPSPKLISFLKKNYKLEDINIQPNKFAVIERYLESL